MKIKSIISAIFASTILIQSVFLISGEAATMEGTPYDSNGNYNVNISHVIINQVYGGKDDGYASHSFIELYNPTEKNINLKGWSVQYISSNDGSDCANFSKHDLNGTILSKGYYLIRCGRTTGTSYAVPNGNEEWDKQIHNKGIAVVLMSNTITISKTSGIFNNKKPTISGYVDMAAAAGNDKTDIQKPASCETATSPIQSKKKAIRRKSFVDTDNNSSDFSDIDYSKTVSDTNKPHVGATSTPSEPIPPTKPESKLNTTSENKKLNYLGSYSVGEQDANGGIAEIVKYNSDNKKIYAISGSKGWLDIVDISNIKSNEQNTYTLEKRIDVSAIAKAQGLKISDITSISINTELDQIALSVQGELYTDNGYALFLDYDGNYIKHFEVGNQPDMICFTPNSKYCITADEGEPREGYTNKVDPKGSISVIDIEKSSVKVYDFTVFDNKINELEKDNVLIKTGSKPSEDFEPEYIDFSKDSKKAYVTLQEANAIATFDLENLKWDTVKGLGFKDFSKKGNEVDINVNGEIKIQNEDNLYGVYMPDGISSTEINGKKYVLTANEGDSREWADYSDLDEKIVNGATKKLKLLKNNEFGALETSKNYILGGRSFSIWDVDTMEQVYDSGADFEKITARVFPDYFNSDHEKVYKDKRSNSKGPEPEDVKILSVGEKTFALIGLERIGGIMVYDISDIGNVKYYDYINIRDFSSSELNNGSDLGAEGICSVMIENSPTGTPLILVGNEISGTVSVIEMKTDDINADYSEVDKALSSIPTDLKGYAQTAVDTLNNAKSNIVRAKNVKDQKVVNKYAENIYNAIKALDKTVNISGDTNRDCNVDIKDLIRIEKYIAQIPVEIHFANSDINSDNNIQADDIVELKKILINQ